MHYLSAVAILVLCITGCSNESADWPVSELEDFSKVSSKHYVSIKGGDTKVFSDFQRKRDGSKSYSFLRFNNDVRLFAGSYEMAGHVRSIRKLFTKIPNSYGYSSKVDIEEFEKVSIKLNNRSIEEHNFPFYGFSFLPQCPVDLRDPDVNCLPKCPVAFRCSYYVLDKYGQRKELIYYNDGDLRYWGRKSVSSKLSSMRTFSARPLSGVDLFSFRNANEKGLTSKEILDAQDGLHEELAHMRQMEYGSRKVKWEVYASQSWFDSLLEKYM